MRRGVLSNDDFLARAPHRYWTYSLWLIAGLTLVALIAYNVFFVQLNVTHVFIVVLFALLSSVALSLTLKHVLASEQPRLMRAFFIFSNIRLLAAIFLIVGYALLSQQRGKELLPFVITLSVYFILQDVLDTLFVVRLRNKVEQEK